MAEKQQDLSSLDSSERTAPLTTEGSVQSNPVSGSFSWTSPSTWSAPSLSGMFKEESCEQKKDKTINAAKVEYNKCATKRSTPKPDGQSSSMFSFLGFGTKSPAAGAGEPVTKGGRKKTQRKQKKNKKNKKGKTNKRKLFGFF